MFQRIGRTDTLRHEVTEYIKKLIEEGKIKPGDRLPTEREMAEQFGVSRTVVRDAVKTLTGIGILEVKHGVGIFAATPDSRFIARQLSGLVSNENDTIKNLFEVRMLLETAAAGWAAERHTEEDLELLLQNIQSHEASVNVNSINSLGEQDRKFHVLVAKSTRNPVIIRLMKSILDLLEVSNRKTLTIEGRAQQSVEEHKDIFRAIEKRNVDEAQNAMKKHLYSVIDSLHLID
jgi:GntR family transcriptional repressor for pyruvate dehydrogenase complex